MTMTTELLIDYLILLIGFVIFMFVQALFINGYYELFRGGCVNDINKGKICTGNIGYMIAPKFFEKYKNTYWSKPLWSCPRCLSSTAGSATFWIPILRLFGFSWFEVFVWIIDIVSLVTLNWYIYKKL